MTSVVSESGVEEETTKSDISKSPTATKKENGILSGFLRLWPLGAKNVSTELALTNSDSATSFYGVYVPCENEDTLHIYTERVEALKVVKKFKQARFKAFKTRQQAVAFALQGAEPAAEKLPADGPSLVFSGNEKSENGKRTPSSPVVGEQTSQFKGPKPQEMVKLRKEIESGSLSNVRDTVWANPRYLVSSGDTPSILHEGTRYNAMHVAAKSGHAEMCNLILSTVGDPAFVKLLYGEDNLQRCKDRAIILLDLYINTPDKAMNETPLHFAVKFGFAEVVDLLTSYPQCNKSNRNKFGYLPKEVICERAKTKDAGTAARIASLLSERFYVPVIHSEGDCNQPLIGEPFEPATPPLLNKDPLSPRMEIRAYAGPMQKQEAVSFRKKWKTPPRQLREPRFRLSDVDKGLEKYGRNLAQQLNIGWKEYWPFLDTFTDLSSIEGLKLLEEYFKSKYSVAYSQVFASSLDESTHLSNANYSNSIVRKLSFSNIVNSDDEVLSPITDLCLALKACTLAECNKRYAPKCRMQSKFEVQNHHQITNEDDSLVEGYVNPSMSPFLCIERSCQVFAKRMADSLLYALSSDLETLEESMKSETKHLQQTVASYMNDIRFNIVDFHLIHSRMAQLTALRITQLAECEYDIGIIAKQLEGVAATSRNSDIYSSDEEDSAALYRQAKSQPEQSKKTAQMLAMHVRCLSDRIASSVNDDQLNEIRATVKSEEESMDAWAEVQKCSCSWQMGQLTRNCRKNASFKRNYLKSMNEERSWNSRNDLTERSEDLLSSSPSYSIGSTQRRLTFRNDHTHGEPDSPVKHCLTILPNITDKNHNSSIVEYNQSLSIPPSDNGHFERLSPLKYRDVEHSGNGEAIQEIAQVLADIQMKRLSSDLMSDDESNTSSCAGSVDAYFTPPTSPSPELADDDNPAECGSDMLDVSDDGAVDVFIYGAVPTKTDRDVLEAISKCPIDSQNYPNLYRWRHHISLFPETERMSWPPAVLDSPMGPLQSCRNLGSLLSTSTPVRTARTRTNSLLNDAADDLNKSAPTLQIASWLRVTGPNSPKSALANHKLRNNISLGF